MLILALLAAIAAEPDTVRPLPGTRGSPSVVVLREPSLPIVALRVALAADDPPGFAGAGHLVQHLHLPWLEQQVARVGGRVQAVRTSDAVVYTVVGPAVELEHLASALTAILQAPGATSTEMMVALRILEQERAAEREVAPAYVRAALRAALFPADMSGAGTDAGARRLAASPLATVWAGMYDPARVSVVAVGDTDLEAVTAAFRRLPAAGAGGPPAAVDSVRPFSADTPQATRAWMARGWDAEGVDAAALTVTARLLRNHLRSRMTRSEVEVEHWWSHHGQGMALIVATPDQLAPVARRTVDGSLAALRETLGEALVRDAAAAVRREMLFFARTPERMANVLGSFFERGDGEDAVQRFFSDVERVTPDDVHAVLDALNGTVPSAVEVAAQRTAP
jgi:predicted Zn-dependent peptidase